MTLFHHDNKTLVWKVGCTERLTLTQETEVCIPTPITVSIGFFKPWRWSLYYFSFSLPDLKHRGHRPESTHMSPFWNSCLGCYEGHIQTAEFVGMRTFLITQRATGVKISMFPLNCRGCTWTHPHILGKIANASSPIWYPQIRFGSIFYSTDNKKGFTIPKITY